MRFAPVVELYSATLSQPRSEFALDAPLRVSLYRAQNVGWIEGCLFGWANFYSKNNKLFNILVEPRGIEPLTSSLRTRRSPN